MTAKGAAGARVEKLVVIGVGLIGGSFALALRRAKLVRRIVGVGRTKKNLDAARERRIIDDATRDAADAVRDADLVLLATPVGQMPEVMAVWEPMGELTDDMEFLHLESAGIGRT